MEHHVWDAMSRNPRLNAVDSDALGAAAEARCHGVHNVIMTDETGAVGVARTVDLEHADAGVPLWAFGNGELATIDAGDTLGTAELKMDSCGVDCLPVLGWEGLLVGVLTRGDIRRYLERVPSHDADRAHQAVYLDLDTNQRCAACGAMRDLSSEHYGDVAFCRGCLAHTRTPEALGDEMYFTVGGEG